MKNEATFQHLFLGEISERLSQRLGINIYQSIANPGPENQTGHDAVLYTDPLAVAPDGTLLDVSKVIALFQFKDGESTSHGREFHISATGEDSQYMRLLEQATRFGNVWYVFNLIDVPPVLQASKGNLIFAVLAFPVTAIRLFAGPVADYHVRYDPTRGICFLRCDQAPGFLVPLPKPDIGETFIRQILLRRGVQGSWLAFQMLEEIKRLDSLSTADRLLSLLADLKKRGFELRRGKTLIIAPPASKSATASEITQSSVPSLETTFPEKLLLEPAERLVTRPDGSQFSIRRKGIIIYRTARRRRGHRFHISREKRLKYSGSIDSGRPSQSKSYGDFPLIPCPETTGQPSEAFLPPTPWDEEYTCASMPEPEGPLTWGWVKKTLNDSLNNLIINNAGKDPTTTTYLMLVNMALNFPWKKLFGFRN